MVSACRASASSRGGADIDLYVCHLGGKAEEGRKPRAPPRYQFFVPRRKRQAFRRRVDVLI